MITLRYHALWSYIIMINRDISRVSLTWLLYNLQLEDVTGTDFENSLYTFGQPEKR